MKQANSVYDLPPTVEAVTCMHATCGYPVKSTWLKAVKAVNFTGWPVIKAQMVATYYPETNETPKGQSGTQFFQIKLGNSQQDLKEETST